MVGVLKQFAAKDSDLMTKNELILSMSRVSNEISYMQVDVLHRAISGYLPQSSSLGGGLDDIKIPINEVVQMLTL